jgi:hypothetical protein
VPDDPAEPKLPMQYAIAMGVLRDDPQLREQVDSVLANRAGDIRALLQRYGVPLVDGAARPTPEF